MNKLKKILSVVLSIGLVASTLVLPMTAEAANEGVNFIHKVTFDEAADATGVFGTGDAYQVVAGNAETDSRFPVLSAKDKVAKLTAGSAGTPADGTAKSYLFSKNWGDNTGVAHATLQFDIALTNSYNEFRVYPAGNGNDGGMKRYGIELPHNVGDNRTLKTLKNSWDRIDTGAVITRFQWYEIAMEWDTTNGIAKVYVDGEVVDTWDAITGSVTPNDFLFQMTNTDNGAAYINNLYYYEGGYRTIVDPEYPVDPVYEYDMTEAADITAVHASGSQVNGFAGKDASDKVLSAVGTSVTNWGAAYNANIMTYEAQVWTEGSQVRFYPNSSGGNNEGSTRNGIYFQNGQVGHVIPWTYTIIDGASYDQRTWTKFALEFNRNTGKVTYYVNGEQVYQAATTFPTAGGVNYDMAFSSDSKTYFVDNYRAYPGAYKGDAAITAASTSKVAVSGTTLSAIEGVTLNELKAVVANYDSIKFYTDTTLATETTDVAAAKAMLVNYGELYKIYDIDITSPYGTKYVNNTFSTEADLDGVSGVAIVDGFGGKDASDTVGNVTAHTGWKDGTWSDEIITAEVQVYADDNKVEMYSGTQIDSKDRPGVYIQNGKIGYVKANGWVYTDVADVDKNMWHKMAIEMNRTTGMTKIYLDGEVVASGTDLFAYGSAHTKDFRIQGNGYIDNWRIYNAAYVADPAIVATATSNVAVSGSTLTASETANNIVTLDTFKAAIADYDSIKFYTDATFATETASVTAAKVMLVKYGELYKKFDLNVTSVYGTKYVWKTFSDAADVEDITGVAIAEGFDGKAATDGVGYVTAHTGWKGGTWSDEILTAEVQVYADGNKIELYSGTQIDGKDRPGVYIQNGKIGYVKANGWVYTAVADVEKDMWHTMAIEMNRTTGMTKIYLDGDVVISGTDLFAYGSAHTQDFRVQGTGYIDNWFIYPGTYVGANTPEPEPISDVLFTTLKTGDVYMRDGVEYVFVAVTTPAIEDISLYDTFRVTDGTVVKEMALSELMTTTLTGAAEIGVLVMNVPAANAANFMAKLVLAD